MIFLADLFIITEILNGNGGTDFVDICGLDNGVGSRMSGLADCCPAN